MSLDRAWLVKAHMALAAFILPVAMLLLKTGQNSRLAAEFLYH
jgi:hypothetical protein